MKIPKRGTMVNDIDKLADQVGAKIKYHQFDNLPSPQRQSWPVLERIAEAQRMMATPPAGVAAPVARSGDAATPTPIPVLAAMMAKTAAADQPAPKPAPAPIPVPAPQAAEPRPPLAGRSFLSRYSASAAAEPAPAAQAESLQALFARLKGANH